MNTTQLSAIVAVFTVMLVFAQVGTAYAATSLATIETKHLRDYKGLYTNVFDVCAGEKNLTDAVIEVSSDKATRTVHVKNLGASECRTYATQLPAMDPKSIHTDFKATYISEPHQDSIEKKTSSNEPTLTTSTMNKLRGGQPGGMDTMRITYKITAGDSPLKDFTISLDSSVDKFEQKITSLAAHKSTTHSLFMKIGNPDSFNAAINN